MLNTLDIQRALCETLREYDVKEAYLFGSYARGDQSAESDVDIRLLCGDSMRVQDVDRIECALEKRLGTPVDIVSAPPSELRPRFYRRISQDEVLLYAS